MPLMDLHTGLKKCSKKDCREINPQPAEAFGRHVRNKDGLNNVCRSCIRRAYREDPERWLGPQREARSNDPEKFRKRSRDFIRKAKENDPETFRETQRQYQLRHRRTNPEKMLWKGARARAKQNGLCFNIDVDDVVIPEVCPILGIPLVIEAGKGWNKWDSSPSLDQVLPNQGYIKGNVQVVSWRANRLKSDATLNELIALGRYAMKVVDEE